MMNFKKIILLLLCSSVIACNSGGNKLEGHPGSGESDYELLSKDLPPYGNCKNEKLCVTSINPATKNYGNNTLSNIPVGNFGLVGYTVKNQTKFDSPAPVASDSVFKIKGMFIDIYRSSCIDNSLSPQEECNLVLKYLPVQYGQKGEFDFKVISGNLKSKDVFESYSSRVGTAAK